MKTIFTRKAIADLASIREYYGNISYQALQNIVDDILSVTDNLATSISRGRNTPNAHVWEKITPQYNYLIPYYRTEDTIYILRVYDSRRTPLDYRYIIDLTL